METCQTRSLYISNSRDQFIPSSWQEFFHKLLDAVNTMTTPIPLMDFLTVPKVKVISRVYKHVTDKIISTNLDIAQVTLELLLSAQPSYAIAQKFIQSSKLSKKQFTAKVVKTFTSVPSAVGYQNVFFLQGMFPLHFRNIVLRKCILHFRNIVLPKCILHFPNILLQNCRMHFCNIVLRKCILHIRNIFLQNSILTQSLYSHC